MVFLLFNFYFVLIQLIYSVMFILAVHPHDSDSDKRSTLLGFFSTDLLGFRVWFPVLCTRSSLRIYFKCGTPCSCTFSFGAPYGVFFFFLHSLSRFQSCSCLDKSEFSPLSVIIRYFFLLWLCSHSIMFRWSSRVSPDGIIPFLFWEE